ncbi:MFS transporter [Sulfolobales archaeon HS-7]|nr:MFS transporter [Sulfolobales archaeon HS-7]
MKPLRTYITMKNFASNLVQPFISFVAASTGILGEQLGLISSAGTALPDIVQFFLSYLKISGKKFTVFGTLLAGIGWIILSFSPFNNLFTILYIVIEIVIGVSSYGWYLIMESVSTSARGRTLAQYSFYSTLGGLGATLITGFIIGDDTFLVRYFFFLCGVLYIFDAWIGTKFDVDYQRTEKISFSFGKQVKSFMLVSFVFYIVWSLAWPVFPLAQVDVFRMNFLQVAIINVIGGSSTLLLQNRIGAIVDKNRKMMMFLGRLGLAAFPLAYGLSPSVYGIYGAELVAGVTNSIGSTAYLAYLYDSSRNTRTVLGLYNAIIGVSVLIGSTIGAFLSSAFIDWLGIDTGIRDLLISIGAMRIAASTLYLYLPEPKPYKTRVSA